jgi:hypothetical protein
MSGDEQRIPLGTIAYSLPLVSLGFMGSLGPDFDSSAHIQRGVVKRGPCISGSYAREASAQRRKT